MNSTSKIYMGGDGNYHDKTPEMLADEATQAPEPIQDGELEGVQVPPDGTESTTELSGDGTGEALPPATDPDPKTATAKTRK